MSSGNNIYGAQIAVFDMWLATAKAHVYIHVMKPTEAG